MSIYTPLSDSQVNHLLADFGLPPARTVTPISAGMENTNYAVATSDGDFVLTLLEQVSADDARFFLELVAALARQGLPVAPPRVTTDQRWFTTFEGKPVSLSQHMPGTHPEAITPHHCRQVGLFLGKLHRCSPTLPTARQQRDRDLWPIRANALKPTMTARQQSLLEDALNHFEQAVSPLDENWIPQGIIHGDLFPDNTLFDARGTLTAVLDFYNATGDWFAYDLAITLNAWCRTETGERDPDRFDALLAAYGEQRPLTAIEQELLPALLAAAAMRFWLSRLATRQQQQAHQDNGTVFTEKDPGEYERMLYQALAEAGTYRGDVD